jgi:hypothetical protein
MKRWLPTWMMIVLAAALLTGCSGDLFSFSEDSNGNTNDNIDATPNDNAPVDNANDNPPGGDNDNDNDESLDETEAETVEAAIDSIEQLAQAFATIQPATDAEDIGDGLLPQMTCPVVSAATGGGVVTWTMVYGEGGEPCSPSLYPDMSVEGTITGTLNTTARTVTMVFDSFMVDDLTIEGTLGGSFNRVPFVSTTFFLNVSLTFNDTDSISGDITFTIDQTTGEVTIAESTIEVDDDEIGEFLLTLTDVAMLPPDLPHQGTATFSTAEVGSVTIEFTSETPSTGVVQVTINGRGPIPYDLNG